MSSLPRTAYETLSQQPDGLRLVFDDLPVGVTLTDKSGTLVMCNREAERTFDRRAAAVSPLEWCWGREIYRPDKKTRY